MHSMTASANLTQRLDSSSWQWEIRTVNQRFLELNFRLPENARHLEMALRQRCKQVLERGKLDITLRYQTPPLQQSLQINTALLQQLTQAINQVQLALPEATQVNPLDILNWPGILANVAPEENSLDDALLASFEQALTQLNMARRQEGEALANVIQQRVEAMRAQIVHLRPLMTEILQAHRQRLQAKLDELAANVDEQRLAAELVLLAQKADIDEELDRLQHHLGEVERVIRQPGAIGRRLDFLMQELNREANTLGSKSIDTRTTEVSVELKVLIEQMREQVQNIE